MLFLIRGSNLYFVYRRQLSKIPESERKFSRACVDSPSDAELYETRLRDGDIVIAYVGLSTYSDMISL